MKFIFIAFLSGILIGTLPKPTVIDQPSPPIVHAESVEKKPEVAEKKVKNIKKLTWRDNPNNCEPTRIRADNLECLPPEPVAVVARSATTPVSMPQCHAWAAEVGLTLNSWAVELIRRESGCDPNIWNRAGSGACGIPQSLPCSKMPQGINTPPPQQLLWMYNYVLARYGSWQQAVYFHDRNDWY